MSKKIFKVKRTYWANWFQYKGVTIDWHDYLGPQIMNRHTAEARPVQNISLRIWGLVTQFSQLPKKEREEHRIF